MDAAAATLIGAGLAAIGAGMAAIGVGNVFGSFLESALRNGLLSFLIAILLYLKA